MSERLLPVASPGEARHYLAALLRRRWPLFAAGVVALAMIAAFTWRIAAERDRAFAAEREARVQATAAERVSDFLVSVFNVSNPRLSGRRVTPTPGRTRAPGGRPSRRTC